MLLLEFLAYLAVRQWVNLLEYLYRYRGQKARLLSQMRHARSYAEWKAAAIAADQRLLRPAFKRAHQWSAYDHRLLLRVHASLTNLLNTLEERPDDPAELAALAALLDQSVRFNFAGIENPRLYSESYYGTKDLIESFIEAERTALRLIRLSNVVSLDDKARLFRSAAKNIGSTALCLSGGASFGYYHFGVVRALLETDLLPRVITGTSAGGLIAAFCCTRTDAELRESLNPGLAKYLTAAEDPFHVWIRRWWRTGARFDPVIWARKVSLHVCVDLG